MRTERPWDGLPHHRLEKKTGEVKVEFKVNGARNPYVISITDDEGEQVIYLSESQVKQVRKAWNV